MPAVPSAHRDRRFVGYSALFVAALATLFAFLTASGVFDETSCLRAGGIYDDATGGCHVSAGVAHLGPSERPLMYALWIGTMALCTLVAWLMLRHRSRHHRGRRHQSSARTGAASDAARPARARRGHRERDARIRHARPDRDEARDHQGNETKEE